MGAKVITPFLSRYIRDNYCRLTALQMSKRKGIAKSTIKTHIKKLGLKKDKKLFWNAQRLDELRTLHPTMRNAVLAKHFGTTENAIGQLASKLKLRKSQEFISQMCIESGKKFGWQQGHKSWNKGMKGLKLSPGQTCFKKGNKPHNTKFDGYISIRQKKGDPPYKYIRIAKSKHVLLHRHVWQQHNGPLPPKHVIVFRDNNSLNCAIDNLKLIPMSENMERNSINRFPVELKSTIHILARYNKKIKQIADGKK